MGQRMSYGTITYSDHLYSDSVILTPRLGEIITVEKVTGRVCNGGLGIVRIGKLTGEGRVENSNSGTVIIGKVSGNAWVRQRPNCGDLTGGTVIIGKATGRHSRVWNTGPGHVIIDELAGASNLVNVSGDVTLDIDEITDEATVVERWSPYGRLKDGGTGLVRKARGRSQITVDGGSVTVEEILGRAGVRLAYGRVGLPANAAGRLSGWLGGDDKPEVPDGLIGAVVERGEALNHSRVNPRWRPVCRWLAE